ncbi:hypothetical protein [Pelistega indica]|nr:hypothetical protein [Pelistega indica]
MLKKLLVIGLMAASAHTIGFAANHEIKMLDNGTDGSIVFEPWFCQGRGG